MMQLTARRALRAMVGKTAAKPSVGPMSWGMDNAYAGFCNAPHGRVRSTPKQARLPRREDGAVRHNKEKGIKAVAMEPMNVHEAITQVKANTWARFDEGFDIAIQLNVDPRKPNQNIRGMAKLPHGSGRTVRVAVFASGESAQAALDAGADVVGSDDLVKSIQQGNLDFDALIASPELMGMVGKLGRILGPRGLMPNPKLGTVTKNVADAVRLSKAGNIQFRVEKKGIIHAGVGRVGFDDRKIADNIRSLMTHISEAKPEGLKGSFIQQVTLTSTMGPSVPVELATIDPSNGKFMLSKAEQGAA